MRRKRILKQQENKKEREIFQYFTNQKIRFSLSSRLVLLVGITVAVSVIVALLLAWLLNWLIPSFDQLPPAVLLVLFSLLIALAVTKVFSHLFFESIKDMREGMKRVADGDFTTRLETNSNSVEIQEMIAGFNLMAKELGSIEMLQSDFVSNVSHEFKTPIGAIEGYTTLLQDTENLSEDQQRYVDKILYNTHRLSSLVSNILFLSKIENLEIPSNQKLYRLDEQIRESIVALETEWSIKDIEFDVDLDEVDYLGDESILHHIWDNLIGNAIKFSPKGGEIRIQLKRKKEEVLFVIEDQGPGITEEAKKHIYDKFYQADTSHKEQGNGLGLALVKRILELVEGGIWVDNLQKGGCRFLVSLPVKKY
ncbi:MAG: HAMP domain-containing histidine kinase [Agathobacter sp.]|nr:HAMP domain-containing histidine kinase [Agathobacter sp.]